MEKVNIGDGSTPRTTFVNKNLKSDHREKMIRLLCEFADCFAWSYTKMSGLSPELVEHRLPIKPGFRPFKQRARQFCPDLYPRIKDTIHQLLEAIFIKPCWYTDWVSNIMSMEKKDSNKLRVCIDFYNLN